MAYSSRLRVRNAKAEPLHAEREEYVSSIPLLRVLVAQAVGRRRYDQPNGACDSEEHHHPIEQAGDPAAAPYISSTMGSSPKSKMAVEADQSKHHACRRYQREHIGNRELPNVPNLSFPVAKHHDSRCGNEHQGKRRVSQTAAVMLFHGEKEVPHEWIDLVQKSRWILHRTAVEITIKRAPPCVLRRVRATRGSNIPIGNPRLGQKQRDALARIVAVSRNRCQGY